MATLADLQFDDSDSEGEEFNPAAEVGSDDEVSRKPARRNQKQAKSSELVVDDDEDDDDDGVKVTPRSRGAEDDEDDADGQGDDDEGEKDDEDDAGEPTANGNDDDDEDDAEEDEEDEDDRPRKRRRRPGHMQFIDEEAEVDDEDEDEEGDEDDLIDETHPDDANDLPIGGEHDDYRHRELDRQRELQAEQDIEEQAKRLREKYGRNNRVSMANTSGTPQHLLLPSVDDPSIWALKCKPGKESEVINTIMKRCAERAEIGQPIFITSAFARGGSMSGYIYVEARKQIEVTKVTENLTFCYASQMQLIAHGEMPDLLRVKKPKEIKEGAYVRMKRPAKYAGDLAQIEEVDQNQSEVTVRLIPRLDPSDDIGGVKRKRPGNPNIRPPQKLLHPSEVSKYGGRRLAQKNTFQIGKDDYVNGFLIKAFPLAAIETENVNPTLEEATKFATTTEGEDGAQTQEIDLSAVAASLKETSTGGDYLVGDAVEIFSGEQQGVKGEAIAVRGDVVTILVKHGQLKNQRIEAPSKTIRKTFQDGDQVKVLQTSKYRGEVGTVLNVKGDKVTLLTESNKREIVVLSRDLRVAQDTSSGPLHSKYLLLDLVQLDAATVGCVVRVDPETLQILDQNGEIRTLLPSSISGKIETRRPTVATDRVGSEIRKDDLVQESAGAQRKGVVLHIHRNFLFLEDKMRLENNGIFIAKSSAVNVVSAKGARMQEGGGSNLGDLNPAMAGQKGSIGSMEPPKGRVQMRGRIDGSECMVIKGQLKGVAGRIRDSTSAYARIEFMNRPGLQTFPLEHLKIKLRSGEWKRLDGSGGSGRTPFSGSRVPGGNMGPPSGSRSGWGDTTSKYGNGSATPSWNAGSYNGAKTPAYGGAGRTSGWGDGARTAYGQNDGSRTSYGGNDGGRTAYGDINSGSRTPAVGAYSAPTPGGYGASAATPAAGGYDAPTPGGYLGAPTPGAIDGPTPRGGNPYSYGTPAASAPTPGAYSAETPGAYSAETPAAFGDDDDDGPRYA